jgi:glycosyltransferase involved in cell wall biosynthesis
MSQPGFGKVALYPNVRKDGIGTYILGLRRHLSIEAIDFDGNILSPKQFLKPVGAGFDIVHVPHFVVPLATGKRKVVCTIQDIIPLFDPDRSFAERTYIKMRIAWSLRRSDHVIFTSKATQDLVGKHFGLPRSASVIPLACDDPSPGSGTGPRPYPFRYFLHIGRRRSHKNVPRVLRALAECADRSVHLVLGGRKDKGDESIIELARSLGVEQRLHFAGFLTPEALAAHYRDAEALVFPSLMEGFGIPILEAMSHGCPVITSNLSSMPEVAGDAALLIDPLRPGEIAAAMFRLISEPGLKAELRERGHRNRNRFHWERMAEATREVYRNLSRAE